MKLYLFFLVLIAFSWSLAPINATFTSSNFAPLGSGVANFASFLSIYDTWRCLYVSGNGGGIPSGSSTMLRVVRPPPVYSDEGVVNAAWAYDTISGGIANGMLLSAYAGDRIVFDGLWNYAKANFLSTKIPGTANCMHWHILSTGEWAANANFWDCSSDAEMDMVYALLIADKRWGGSSYFTAASNLASVVVTNEVDSGNILKYGSRTSSGGASQTNPSYYATGYWKLFATVFNESKWNTLRTSSFQVITTLNTISGNTGLVPEWCKSDGTPSPTVTSVSGYWYSYYAVRFPWRMATDLLWYNSAKAGSQCELLVNHWDANYVTTGVASVGEEVLTGGFTTNIDSRTDLSFLSPAFTCSLFSTTSSLKDRIWSSMENYFLGDYNKDALYALSYLFAIGRFELPSALTSVPDHLYGTCNLPKYTVKINAYCTSGPYEFHTEFSPTAQAAGTTNFQAASSLSGPWSPMTWEEAWGSAEYPSKWWKSVDVGPYPVYVQAEGQIWECPYCDHNGDLLCTYLNFFVSNSPSVSSSISTSLSPSRSLSSTASVSLSRTRTRTVSPSGSASTSMTPSVSRSSSISRSITPSQSPTSSNSRSSSPTRTVTPSGSTSATPSITSSETPTSSTTQSVSASRTASKSKSKTPSTSNSYGISKTRPASKTRSLSKTKSISKTKAISKTKSISQSRTISKVVAVTNSRTKSRTRSRTRSRTQSRSQSKAAASRSRTRSKSRSKSRSRTRSRSMSKAAKK